jgi:hypothetical protein
MTKPSCYECRYYQYDADASARGMRSDYGDCRRLPPSQKGRRWPEVRRTDWCGDFVDRKEDKP